MKKSISILLLCALLSAFAMPALASNFYIIPDSHTRRLTEAELWEWQYDALGYILNEIFARHGYHFNHGGKYYNYFNSQVWYQENKTYATNAEITHNLVTSMEWTNEHLVKVVREQMRALGTTNPNGKPLPKVSYEPPIGGAFSSFVVVPFGGNQRLPVYSGPGTHYLRGADGKAVASTNGLVYAGGFDNGWLMVMYWTNNGNVRVGYTPSSAYKEKISAPMLQFDYISAVTRSACVITDDPVATYTTMASLPQGAQVTFLSEYVNEYQWAYIEAAVNGQLMRGFIPYGSLSLSVMEEDPDYK